MEIFNAIGLEIPPGKTLNDLAEDAEKFGEASLSARTSGVIHGHCWRIGFGLEVWTILYESNVGKIVYADCRPAFRSRFTQNIKLWSLLEDEAEGEAAIEGFTDDAGVRVFFQLQNLTETKAKIFERKLLKVGLCGLAHSAEIVPAKEKPFWKSLSKVVGKTEADENDWRLCGQVLDFKLLCNPHTGNEVYWIHIDLDNFDLEILVNRQTLSGAKRLRVGSRIKADVWLQGHIINQTNFISNYEGVDWSSTKADFWKHLKKLN